MGEGSKRFDAAGCDDYTRNNNLKETLDFPNLIAQSDFPVFAGGMGRTLIHVSETDSTNRVAKTWVQSQQNNPQAELDGTVFLADHQTAGRGRLNRVWTASPGQNILVSVLVHLPGAQNHDMTARGLLPLAAALAVADVISAFAVTNSIGIKWPNDVLLDGHKCSGILVEAGSNNVFIVGVGLNVNESHFPDALQHSATSLLLHTGRHCDRKDVYAKLMAALTEKVTLLRTNSSVLLDEYRNRVSGIGKVVRLHTGTSVVEGIMKGIHSDGGLIVELVAEAADSSVSTSPSNPANTAQKVYYAGDVTLSPSASN